MKLTSAPRSASASATASAGTTCPAVPPAAITTRGTSTSRSPDGPGARAAAVEDAKVAPAGRARRPGGHRRRPARGDVEQQPDGREGDDEAAVAVGDEWERDAGQRREAEDREEVDRCLNQDHRRQGGGEQATVAVARP